MCVIINDISNGGSLYLYSFNFLLLFFFVQGLATIPVSAFYSPEHGKDFDKYIRFCFVKVSPTTLVGCKFSLLTSRIIFTPQEDSTLDAAADIFKKWRKGQ